MDIQIGSHLYRNSNGTIEIEGVPQIDIRAAFFGRIPESQFCPL